MINKSLLNIKDIADIKNIEKISDIRDIENISSIEDRKYTENIKYFFIASIVAISNVVFVNNYIMSLIIVVFEVLILLYYFIKKKFTKFLSFYLIFLSLSFEFEEFIGSSKIYGFKNVRIFGINLGVIVLLPVVLYIIFKGSKWLKLKDINKCLYTFVILLLTLFFMGLFFGLINILLNDNNIIGLGNVLSLFLNRLYDLMLFPLLIIILFTYILLTEREKIKVIPSALLAILFASIVAMLTSIIVKKYGAYGGVITLLAPLVSCYIPFMLLFLHNNMSLKYKIFIVLMYIVGILLLGIYNASGKLIILTILVPIILIFISISQKKPTSIFFILLLLPLIICLFVYFVLINYNDNILLSVKINQVNSLFNIFDDYWLINLPQSPKFRIAELYNIILEYIKKPWFIIFGKGYLGSIKDYINMFEYSTGAFSELQWEHGVFYILHTSLNSILITHGAMGIGFIIYILRLTYKKLYKSKWGIVGVYWFIIYYGYSITISAFGLVSLLYGLYEINLKE